MRDDQLKRLDDLAESVMDTFLDAADPSTWTGAGQAADAMDPQTRGARNWDCKNANQIGALVARVLDLKGRIAGENGGPEKPDDEADADIARFERAAKEAMKKAGIVANGKA
jgi:hypothetical protein